MKNVFLALEQARTNVVRQAWDRLSRIPGGRRAFSAAIGRMAPYTGSIGARVLELGERHSKVSMGDRRGLRNHLRSVHAIALANLAELAGNVALAYTLPDDARFIVKGMDIEYVKKARGRIVAEGQCPAIPSAESSEYEVDVVLRDSAGDPVAKAKLRTLVGPKKRS